MILDGKKLSEEIIGGLKSEITALRAYGAIPGLGVLLVGENAASQLYVSMKQRTAEELGMRCKLVSLPIDASEHQAIAALKQMNADPGVHGMIVQLPLPKEFSQERVCAAIEQKKDVDALSPITLSRLEQGDSSVIPPTAEAVRRLILESGRDPADTRVIVVGSGFFGRQITHHLKNNGAIIHQYPFRTGRLWEITTRADIVITTVGRPLCIGPEYIKEGAIIIDVGISRKDGTVVGDLDFDRVQEKAFAVTPVPGGVGPVTVACLLSNVVRAARAALTQ